MTYRRFFAALALLCALATTSHAQTGSPKTPAQLNAEINARLITNGKQQITAFDFRQVLLDFVSSIFGTGQPVNWVTPQSFGAKCDNATDDAAALQAAVNSLPVTGGVIYTAPGSTCNSSQSIVIPPGSDGITLLGFSSKNERIFTPSMWKYTGTGPRFIDARESRGFKTQGMSVKYSSLSGFTGTLIDLGALTPPGPTGVSAFASLIDTNLGPDTHRTGTATLVDASSTVAFVADSVYFEAGEPSIRGQAVLGGSNVATISNSVFYNSVGAPIVECGESWAVTGSTFENVSSGQGLAFLGSTSLPCKGMVWKSNWFGDFTVGGGTLLDGSFLGLDFSSNKISGPLQNVLTLRSSSGISVKNNYIESLAVAVNCVSSNVGVQVSYNKFVSVATQVSNPAGCGAGLNTDGNDPPASQPWTPYSCTATAQTPGGTPPTFTVNNCRYTINGKSATARADVSVTAAGTGTGSILITLPFTATAFKFVGSGAEYIAGSGGVCLIPASGATMACAAATGASYIVTGQAIVGEVQFEVP